MAINDSLSKIVMIWGGIVLAFFLAFGISKNVLAQESEPTWSSPINLSQSGASDTPVMTVSSDGTVFVVWQDEVSGPVYASRTGEQWSAPKPIAFPFGEFVPRLIADGLGNIHAFWIGNDDSFFYSRVKVENFGTTNWSGARLMDTSVIAFDVVLDAKNELKVSYVRSLGTDKFPTGVYFQQSTSNGATWIAPLLLYQSLYLRQLTAEQIKIDTLVYTHSENEQSLYVLWDNRPRKQMFMAISEDNGVTWGDIIEVRGPASSISTPEAVGFTIDHDQLLVIWQEKLSDTNCRQFFQTFTSTGETIISPQTMLSEFPVCPESNQIITLPSEFTILQTSMFNINYLLAWDGNVWSEPQIQQELSNFIDLETLDAIDLKCPQTVFGIEKELLSVGCDNNPGGDIWFTSRKLQGILDWFSVPSGWTQPASIFTTNNKISSISMSADNEGRLHAIWAQSNTEIEGDTVLYYARWSGDNWSYIVSILNPPLGHADNIVTAIDAEGKLFLIWSGGQTGEIYFSWANANLASNPSEWATPVILPMPRSVGASPDIVVRENGEIYVVYAIPLNENRGLYITKSTDGGQTWSDPTQIIDGVSNRWEMMGNIALSISPTGEIYVLFLRLPPPGGIDPSSLFYSQSKDNGVTWSTPEEVVRSEISSIWLESFNSVIYRVWEEEKNNTLVTFLETSVNAGLTWTEPVDFTDFSSGQQLSHVVLDHSGRLHLIQLVEDDKNVLVLQEWVWENNKWVKEDRRVIGQGALLEGKQFITAAITSKGYLGVLTTNPVSELQASENEIIFTSLKLDQDTEVLVTTPNPEPTQGITITPEGVFTPTETPQITPTQVSERPSNQATIDSNIMGPVVGFVAAGLIIIFAFVIINRFANRNV